MKYILIVIAVALIPGIVCGAQTSDFSLRARYNASSSGDIVSSGFQPVVFEGYLRLANAGGISPLTNVTVTLLADNLTKVDDPAYAQLTRSSANWVYPQNFTITNTAKVIDWTTDTNPTINVPVAFSRTLNQTTFSQNGYQLVQCNVTFWNKTDVTIIWGEIDNYKRDKVNVTILNDTFTTDLPNSTIMWQNNKQYQFSMQNMSAIIIGHPYTFSIVLKIDRVDPTKTITYKPLCGINLITTIAQKNVVGSHQSITIPELPVYVHQASASVNEMVNWSYWSHYEKSALLLENSAQSIPLTKNSSGIAIFRPLTGYWYFDHNLDGVVNKSFRFGGAGDKIIKGDWQGDNKTGIAIFRNTTGYWYFDYNLDGIVDKSFRYGGVGDKIIKGNWQGTGSDGIAIHRPSTGYWYFDYNLDGTVDKSFRYGGAGDKIIKGDWQGTGKDGIAIFRPSTGYWYFDYNLDGVVDKSIRFGGSADEIIVGKWQGTNDGIAIFRPSTGYWYFDFNLDGIVDKNFRYGGSTDEIIKGDWNGSGNDGIAIFRSSTGFWYFDYNLDGIVDKYFRFGGTGDQIIAGKWA